MNKKALIIVTSLLIVVVIGVGSLFYYLSFKTVTFTIIPDDIEVVVFNRDNNEVARLTQDGSLRLQAGNYTANPVNEAYSSTPVPFTVSDQDVSVSVDPSYSLDRLDDMRDKEEPIVVQKLRDTYADVISNFTIEPGKLYGKGDWYATLLPENPLQGGQQGDVYRVVLHKTDNQWQIVAGPAIILTSPQNPDVPAEILSDINEKQS